MRCPYITTIYLFEHRFYNMASSENPPMKGKWIDLINESVHTADDVDIGDIDAVNIDFIACHNT
jgi:hypothetical protein